MSKGSTFVTNDPANGYHEKKDVHHYYLPGSGQCRSFTHSPAIMNRRFLSIALFTGHFDILLQVGLLCWLGIFQSLNSPAHNWYAFLHTTGRLALALSPILVFSWFKAGWKQKLPMPRYLLYWSLCFAVYLPLLAIGVSKLVPAGAWHDLLVTAALCSLLLELIAVATGYYRQRVQQWGWIRRLSLEKSILISIVLISVILSAMAVSSTGDPRYDTGKQLLIGFEFDAWKILRHFGAFLGFVIQFLFVYLCGYFFFFLNNRLLVPRVLKPRGVIAYVLAGLALVALTYPLVATLLTLLPLNSRLGRLIFEENPFDLENALGAILIIVLSLPLVLALQWSKQNSRIAALEQEKTQTELDLLKQQLNPHFFFNTLNNLYALSLQQSKQTPDSILQLSELMRYVIYKAKEPQVTLPEEIKYLEDYIQLQQMRLKRTPDIQFTQEIAAGTPSIAPLLLIVLVENAFKHGIEPAAEQAFLHITLRTQGNRLYFQVVNSFEQPAERDTGIGLANLQRRLTLLYPGKHRLITAAENHTFKAELELDLP